jgi:hypothetical protein
MRSHTARLLEETIATLRAQLALAAATNESLGELLAREREKNAEFEKRINREWGVGYEEGHAAALEDMHAIKTARGRR